MSEHIEGEESRPALFTLDGQLKNLTEVRQALAAGADPNEPFDDSVTAVYPIQCALDAPDAVELVRALLAAGANPNQQDHFSRTPLHDVPEGGCAELVDLLVEQCGAHALARDRVGQQALHYAAVRDVGPVTYKLFELNELDAKDEAGETPLYKAAAVGQPGFIREAVSRGANLEAREKYGGATALHVAAKHCNIRSIEALVELGLSVGVTNDRGNTPLHEAVSFGSHEAILCLLALGADKEVVNHDGLTPVEVATDQETVDLFFAYERAETLSNEVGFSAPAQGPTL